MPEKTVLTASGDQTAALCGPRDVFLTLLEDRFSVRIVNSASGAGDAGDALTVSGPADGVEKAAKALEYLKRMTAGGDALSDQSVEYVVSMISDGLEEELAGYNGNVICITNRGKPIKPKTVGQRVYADLIRKNTVVLGIGPAGTGKTFLAVAMAVDALRNKEVTRIILTRPAVEAGEKLGFLPGDLAQKVDPYLRPLYDALHDMLGVEAYQRLVERGAIEVAPLAYMRGRTLNDAFIILDEAQNTTSEQMKMFLTRMGMGSKMVITGDVTQIDLPVGKRSGLVEALEVLKGVDDIGIARLTHRDVVRHELVQAIVKAYEKYDQRNERRNPFARS